MKLSGSRGVTVENDPSSAVVLDRAVTHLRDEHQAESLPIRSDSTPHSEENAEEPWWRVSAAQAIVPDQQTAAESRTYAVCKRVIDIVGSLLLLILLMPVFIVIAFLIKATSAGPILFKQKRIGKNGKEFLNYKFRTMVADAEQRLRSDPELKAQFIQTFKIKNDPRVTRVGAFLRKTSLDETPQFFNVLRGDISLIGPRALQWAELSRYGEDAGKVIAVKPGLSGMWQVRGRSDTSYAERVALDLAYIENRSVWLDLKLMLETVVVVIKGQGAC